jgi:hypothetical protein
MSKFVLIVILMFLGLSGCKSVKPEQLTGTWLITNDSLKNVPIELRKNSARIVLNADGSFTAFDLPSEFHFSPDGHGPGGGKGDWKLAWQEGRLRVQLVFHEITNKGIPGPFGMPLEISRGWSSIESLYYFWGDPDSGRRVEFERK